MNRIRLRHSLMLSMLTACAGAQADVYKWVDQTGGVHYGDAPGEAEARIVEIEHPQVRQEEADDLQQRRQRIQEWVDARHEERARKQLEQAERRKNAAEKDAHCAKLERDLHDRELGGIAWYRLGDDGTRHYLSDQEISQETLALREQLASDCR